MRQKKKPRAKRKRPKSVGRSNTEVKATGRQKYSNMWRGWTHKGWPTAKKDKGFVKEKNKYSYPSHYGSHSSMVVSRQRHLLDNLSKDGDVIVLEDERGEYSTTRKYIDSGLADPNRMRCAA
jgi:hypothetical protein